MNVSIPIAALVAGKRILIHFSMNLPRATGQREATTP